MAVKAVNWARDALLTETIPTDFWKALKGRPGRTLLIPGCSCCKLGKLAPSQGTGPAFFNSEFGKPADFLPSSLAFEELLLRLASVYTAVLVGRLEGHSCRVRWSYSCDRTLHAERQLLYSVLGD